MAFLGWMALFMAFLASLASVVLLLAGHVVAKGNPERADSLAYSGRLTAIVGALALTVCCGVLVVCFLGDNNTIQYVLENRSDASGPLSWLYKLSGLWAGREGSLLFWAWLISLFAAVMAVRGMKKADRLDNGALAVVELVLFAFVAVLLLSNDNMPFIATSSMYLDYDTGELTAAGTLQGMNTLLEHWAMAIHPPTLFVGYAGLTVPFAYAVAALIINDPSSAWVRKAQRYALFSWLFLTIGIALGAMWAYVVLGWGGYWGWDPVENASLLSWLASIILIHSMTVYLRHGQLKGWAVMGACLAFAFVIVGTFISRSGIVQSVHAFEGDAVSLMLFGMLILASVLVGAIGLIVRRKTFLAPPKATGKDASKDAAFLSRSTMYFLSNVLVLVMTVLLTYMTVASALPSWMPGGGDSLSTGSYNAIARPIGIVYFLILAICPLLGWAKRDGKAFWRKARIPGICAAILFVLLLIEFFVKLLPAYQAVIAAGGSDAVGLQAEGASWYYNGLAIVGFAVASLLFFNALFMLINAFKGMRKGRGRMSTIGGALTHMAFGVLLIGLIGSTMYVTTMDFYLDDPSEQEDAAVAAEPMDASLVGGYRLLCTASDIEMMENEDDVLYTVHLDVYKGADTIASIDPSVQMVASTMQTKQNAQVVHGLLEDYFVVYRGAGVDGGLSIEARVNPLISLVWIGALLMCIGMALSAFSPRRLRAQAKRPSSEVPRGPKSLSDGMPSDGSACCKAE